MYESPEDREVVIAGIRVCSTAKTRRVAGNVLIRKQSMPGCVQQQLQFKGNEKVLKDLCQEIHDLI